MKEATITPILEKESKTAVTGDDLKHEIGEWVVASLQKGKVIKELFSQLLLLKKQLEDQKAQLDQANDLKAANARLGGKNIALGDELTTLRGELKAVKVEIDRRDKTIKALREIETKYGAVVQENAAFTGELKKAQEAVAELGRTIHDLRKKPKKAKSKRKG